MRTQRNLDNERMQSCEVFEMWYGFLAHTPAKTVSKPPRHARRGQRRKKKVYTRRVDNKLRAVKEEKKEKDIVHRINQSSPQLKVTEYKKRFKETQPKETPT